MFWENKEISMYGTKWGRAWWELWFKNHRDQTEFWILFQIWQGVISRFWAKEWRGQKKKKKWRGQIYVPMGSILLPNEKDIIEGQGWKQRDWREYSGRETWEIFRLRKCLSWQELLIDWMWSVWLQSEVFKIWFRQLIEWRCHLPRRGLGLGK